MADVTITRSGDLFLVRAHSPDGEEYIDDMFGNIIVLDDNRNQIGRERWPTRDGARVVEPKYVDDDVLGEAENRGIVLRVL